MQLRNNSKVHSNNRNGRGWHARSAINSNSLLECTVPVGTRTPHGPM